MITSTEHEIVDAFDSWLAEQPFEVRKVVNTHIATLCMKCKRMGIKGAMQLLAKIYLLIAPKCNWDNVASKDFDGCNGCPGCVANRV